MATTETPSPPALILASGSPYRRQLLERLGLHFRVVSPDVDESPQSNESAPQLARRLALDKAQAVASRHPDAIVIGSDQVAECEGRLLGKPGTAERAIAQLEWSSGRTIEFHTALALVRGERIRIALVPTRVKMRTLSPDRIRRYVAADEPFNCAGALKSEALGICLAESMRSDDPTALIGLPLIALVSLLGDFDVTVPPAR